MKVKFQRTWFDPRGQRVRKGVHENIPDSWCYKLPSDADVLEMSGEVAPVAETSVKDERLMFDPERAAFEAQAKAIQDANDEEAVRIKAAAAFAEEEAAQAAAKVAKADAKADTSAGTKPDEGDDNVKK